jgi:hypothetical protein
MAALDSQCRASMSAFVKDQQITSAGELFASAAWFSTAILFQ